MKSGAMGLPGGPAFPISIPGYGDNGCPGMSLRDWFAGLAMQALIVCEVRPRDKAETRAKKAYEVADAMIAQRDKEAG